MVRVQRPTSSAKVLKRRRRHPVARLTNGLEALALADARGERLGHLHEYVDLDYGKSARPTADVSSIYRELYEDAAIGYSDYA